VRVIVTLAGRPLHDRAVEEADRISNRAAMEDGRQQARDSVGRALEDDARRDGLVEEIWACVSGCPASSGAMRSNLRRLAAVHELAAAFRSSVISFGVGGQVVTTADYAGLLNWRSILTL